MHRIDLSLATTNNVVPFRRYTVAQVLDDWNAGFLLQLVLPDLLKIATDTSPMFTLSSIRRHIEVAAENPEAIVWQRYRRTPTLHPLDVALSFRLTGAAACLLLTLHAVMMGETRPGIETVDDWLDEALGHVDAMLAGYSAAQAGVVL